MSTPETTPEEVAKFLASKRANDKIKAPKLKAVLPAGCIAADSPESLALAAKYRTEREAARAINQTKAPGHSEATLIAQGWTPALLKQHGMYAASGATTVPADTLTSIPPAPAEMPVEPWPEPEDVFKKLSAPAFTGSELPHELVAFARLMAQETGFDPGIGMNAALSVAAMAIDDCIQVCANPSTRWNESARLWFIAIAAPATGKTPAQAPLTAPLWAIHKKLYNDWLAAVEAYNAIPKKTRPRDPPIAPRALLTDTTIAKLSDVLKDNPRGIGLVIDEFSSWLGALDMQANAGAGGHDRGEALMLFQGGHHHIERVQRGSIFVPNWSAGILTASTPSQMGRYEKHLPEDGLIQRFLPYLACDKVTPVPIDPQELEGARQRYDATIQKLWNLHALTNSGVVQMTPEAKDYFMDWSAGIDEHVKAYRVLLPPLAGHIGKYASMALRIGLTLHCVKMVNEPPASHGMYDVTTKFLDLATITAATTYLAAIAVHAKVMYQDLNGGSPSTNVAREVARYLMVRKEPDSVLARRDLLRDVHAYDRAPEPVQGEAMRFLEEMGWVRVTQGGQRRSTGPTRYVTNPSVAKVFAVQAVAEVTRRKLARELIGIAATARREDQS